MEREVSLVPTWGHWSPRDEGSCSLQSVSASFRWKTWIHSSGMWEYVPIDEPLLPWNQDATCLLSGYTLLQQGLEAGALLASGSDSGSKNPPPTYWAQFIFGFFSSQHLVTCAFAWVSDWMLSIMPLLPTHLWPLFLCSSNPSLHILLFFNKSRMVKECRFQTVSFQSVAGSA